MADSTLIPENVLVKPEYMEPIVHAEYALEAINHKVENDSQYELLQEDIDHLNDVFHALKDAAIYVAELKDGGHLLDGEFEENMSRISSTFIDIANTVIRISKNDQPISLKGPLERVGLPFLPQILSKEVRSNATKKVSQLLPTIEDIKVYSAFLNSVTDEANQVVYLESVGFFKISEDPYKIVTNLYKDLRESGAETDVFVALVQKYLQEVTSVGNRLKDETPMVHQLKDSVLSVVELLISQIVSLRIATTDRFITQILPTELGPLLDTLIAGKNLRYSQLLSILSRIHYMNKRALNLSKDTPEEVLRWEYIPTVDETLKLINDKSNGMGVKLVTYDENLGFSVAGQEEQ